MFQKTNISNPLICTQRNASFPENFTHVPNGWSLTLPSLTGTLISFHMKLVYNKSSGTGPENVTGPEIVNVVYTYKKIS